LDTSDLPRDITKRPKLLSDCVVEELHIIMKEISNLKSVAMGMHLGLLVKHIEDRRLYPALNAPPFRLHEHIPCPVSTFDLRNTICAIAREVDFRKQPRMVRMQL
jgi:hypothetical protein